MEMEKKQLEYLDSMRGFAMILVVVGHLMITFGVPGYENVVWQILRSVHLSIFPF